jgi:hypothetical protein
MTGQIARGQTISCFMQSLLDNEERCIPARRSLLAPLRLYDPEASSGK